MLVSSVAPVSALMTVDVKIFRHEFIIFRLSETKTLHPADIRIVEVIDEQMTRYDEEHETVLLAKDLREKMRKMMMTRVMPHPRSQYSQMRRR